MTAKISSGHLWLRGENLAVNNNFMSYELLGLWLWCLTPLSTIFMLYHGRGEGQVYWSRVPGKYYRKSLTNFFTLCCIEYTLPERDSNSQRTIISWFLNCNIPIARHTCTCTTYSGGYIFVLSLRSPLLCCR
jgi:hypothetical protein